MKVIRSKAGKTLELVVELEGDTIRRVEISGDFMVSPKEAIEELERKLKGVKVGEHEGIIRDVLEGVELVGITLEDIVNAIGELRDRSQ